MASTTYKQFGQLSFGDLEVYSVLPAHPIWSKVNELIDFEFADHICAPLYSTRGPRPYAPSLKLKLHIVQRYYNLSDREMEERVIGDLFIKRFLGLPVCFTGFDHSTIGLDRERMGSELFHACHHRILAQAKRAGLWGDSKEVWLVDSFHTHSHVVRLNAYRLIKQAIVQLLNHLKRAYRSLFQQLQKACDWTPLTAKLPFEPSPEDFQIAFSHLVTLAYSLLYWFESDSIRPLFWSWAEKDRQLTSLEYQAVLYQILMENVHPQDPEDPKLHKKRERKDRPKDRVLSAVAPDLRTGAKSTKVFFFGDKIQVVTSARHNIVLNAEPIAGNEPDGDRLMELVNDVRERQQVMPVAVVADSAYGYGRNRRKFAGQEIQLVAPLKKVGENQTGLFSNELFIYNAETKKLICPAGKASSRSSRNHENEGMQYNFRKRTCMQCPLREQCTTSTTVGRGVFISDYIEEFRHAKAYNETDEGKALLAIRSGIERKNHEMKNHNGLGQSDLRTREKRRVAVKLVSMVVNLKQIVRQKGTITLGFVRKKIPPNKGPSLSIA